jgi:hypothetical protein
MFIPMTFQLDYDPKVLSFVDASTPYLPNSWMLFFNADSVGLLNMVVWTVVEEISLLEQIQ